MNITGIETKDNGLQWLENNLKDGEYDLEDGGKGCGYGYFRDTFC